MLMPRITLHVLLALLPAAVAIAQDDVTGERKLATIPKDLKLIETSTGPDGSQFTTNAMFLFGAGGKFVVYGGFRGGKSVAMAGDEELGEFHFLDWPVMDANATHYAFRAGNRTSPTKEKWWAIVDGKKGKAFAWIGSVALNSAGKAAFWEQPGARVTKEGPYNNSSMLLHVGKSKGKKFEQAMSLYVCLGFGKRRKPRARNVLIRCTHYAKRGGLFERLVRSWVSTRQGLRTCTLKQS